MKRVLYDDAEDFQDAAWRVLYSAVQELEVQMGVMCSDSQEPQMPSVVKVGYLQLPEGQLWSGVTDCCGEREEKSAA